MSDLSDSAKAFYAEHCKERVSIRRFTGAGPSRPRFDTDARALVSGYEPRELVGAIVQGDRKIIVFADDLITNGLPLPVTTDDKVVVDGGKELAILAPDRLRVDGVLVALQIQARG